MKTIIAGSRSIDDFKLLEQAIEAAPFDVTDVVSGGARRGVDVLGERWAKQRALPLTIVLANWAKYGRAAGLIRNEEMARHYQVEACIVVWDGKSPGSRHMIRTARKFGLKLFIADITKLPFNKELRYA